MNIALKLKQIEGFVDRWKQPGHSQQDKKDIIQAIIGEASLSDDAFNNMFQEITQNSQEIIQHLQQISFANLDGFETLHIEDVYRYFLSHDMLSISLKRDRGKGLLYGLEHVIYRRQFMNGLSQKTRLFIIENKLSTLGLSDILKKECVGNLYDIQDVGMGNSVFVMAFEKTGGNNRSIILKKKESDFQVFYCKLLTVLGWPSYTTFTISTPFGEWEVSDYFEVGNLNQSISSIHEISHLEQLLSKHAALGDVLGRGDRHVENYLYDKTLLPIDVSYLFYKDNHEWTYRYIAGGVYELSILQRYKNDLDLLKSHMARYWNHYWQTLLYIKSHEKLILDQIESFFQSEKKQTYMAYIVENLHNPEGFLKKTKEECQRAFIDLLNRVVYKESLDKLVKQGVQVGDELYMYWMAHQKRLSTFLHIELRDADKIFMKIQQLSKQYLGVSDDYFINQKKSIDKIADILKV